jgi:hypothetical protein
VGSQFHFGGAVVRIEDKAQLLESAAAKFLKQQAHLMGTSPQLTKMNSGAAMRISLLSSMTIWLVNTIRIHRRLS